MAHTPKSATVVVNASRLDSLDVIALLAICARFLSDWDYSLGVHHFPTWIGPAGEAEAMSDREVRLVRLILKTLGGTRPS